MAFHLAEAFVDFKPRGYREVETAVDGIRGSLLSVARLAKGPVGTLLGLAGGGIGIAGSGVVTVLNGIGSALSQYAEHERNIKLVNAQLRATGGAAGLTSQQLQRMAADFQQVTAFSDETTLAAQRALLGFTNIRGNVFQSAIEGAMDMSTALGQDLQGSITQIGKALNDPTKGLRSLTDAGVAFTENQKDVIRTLQESGDVMGAQKVILAELTNEFGGAAQADMKTFDGPVISLKNAFRELLQVIGKVVAESANNRSAQFNESRNTFMGQPGEPAEKDNNGPTIFDQLREIREKTPDVPAAQTSSRFNIADLAGNIQTSLLNKRGKDLHDTAVATREMAIKLDQLNALVEKIPGFVFS